MSKPTICTPCHSGSHGRCLKTFGNWSAVVPPPLWWQLRRKRQRVNLGNEWSCVCYCRRTS